MKKVISICLIFGLIMQVSAQDWKPVGDRIKTYWAEKVDPSSPLPEYPRPQMVRDDWQNLNGLWDYAILERGSYFPSAYDGRILVPYPVESSLSGVQRSVGEENELWYHTSFILPGGWEGKNVLLHFGAIDWKADIWLNGVKIGSHTGGFAPFYFNITSVLEKKTPQDLVVRVWDPTDNSYQPRGKQVENPRGILYTAVTGIWQTVWLEAVDHDSYIRHVKTVPDLDGSTVSVSSSIDGIEYGKIVEVKVLDDGRVVGTGKALAGQEVLVGVPGAKPWSPESPFLYDLEITLLQDGRQIDRVRSYFGMRKISIKADENGIMRLQLNNEDYFQFGPLDQGWWPDGLYTAPTDEALLFDIRKTKDLGFNMIRKHVKVEPARWYYHCDREGILVWQDMPSGDRSPEWQRWTFFNGREFERSLQSEQNFRSEWKAIMDLTISNPSVVVWVPFNERWGQFKTREIVEWTKLYDPSRLVDPASGGNHYPVGDMLDMHNYPEPRFGLYDPERSCVLGEYGGIGLAMEGHLWEANRNWGYVQYKDPEEATDAYLDMIEILKSLIPRGYSAAVYTQITDVEIEVNGLLTYDRKVVKMQEDRIKKANREVCNFLSK